MKLTSIGLIARGLIVVASSVMAANNTLQQVQAALAGLFFARRACRSETPGAEHWPCVRNAASRDPRSAEHL